MSDKSKGELEDRVEELEATVSKMLPSRRQVLKGGATAATAGMLGFSAGNASAQASTEDGNGNIGLPDDRVDVFADGVNTNEATINDVGITPSRDATRPDAHVARTEVSNLPASHMHQGERIHGPIIHPLYQEETVTSTTWADLSDNPSEHRLSAHFNCPASMVPVLWINATITNDTSGEQTSLRVRQFHGDFEVVAEVTSDGTTSFQNLYQEAYFHEVPQSSARVHRFNGPSLGLQKTTTGGTGTIHPRTAIGIDYEVI